MFSWWANEIPNFVVIDVEEGGLNLPFALEIFDSRFFRIERGIIPSRSDPAGLQMEKNLFLFISIGGLAGLELEGVIKCRS